MTLFILLLMTFPTTAQTDVTLPEGFEDTGTGFNVSYGTGIDIANMINDLQRRVEVLKSEKVDLEQALKTEREASDEVIEQAQETIDSLKGEIKALQDLVDALKDLNSNLENANQMLRQQQFESKVTTGAISFGVGFAIGVLSFLAIVN